MGTTNFQLEGVFSLEQHDHNFTRTEQSNQGFLVSDNPQLTVLSTLSGDGVSLEWTISWHQDGGVPLQQAGSPSTDNIAGGYPLPHTTARAAIGQLGADTQIQTGLEAVKASGLFEAADHRTQFCTHFLHKTRKCMFMNSKKQ